MWLSPNDRVGPYTIVAPLGAGGMGEVYRARDSRLGRDVALKILPAAAHNSDAWARFEREARASSTLNHPNICALYDIGEFDGRPFLVLEMIEGVTLTELINRRPMPPATAVPIALQVTSAVGAAHAKGIIHRDIKPGNVMVTADQYVKVLDFGLAKPILDIAAASDAMTRHPVTVEGAILGTPHYLAPEVLRGQQATTRSDVWGIGAVLYEMLVGHAPFAGATAFEVGDAILNEPTPALPSTVPSTLRAVVERCLAKRPEERYADAQEVHRALLPLVESSPVDAPSVPPRRARGVALGIGLSAILALGIAGWWSLSQPPARRLSTGALPSQNQLANEAFELAIQFQSVQNDVPRANQALDRAIALDPRFAEALRYRAINSVILLLNGYSNDASLLYRAEEDLRRISEIDPDLPGLSAAYASVYLTQGRRELVPWGSLERELRDDPTHPTNRLWSGIGSWLAGDFVSARESFRAILTERPLFGPARMFLGEVLRDEGDAAQAIRELETVLEHAPTNTAAMWWLTLACLDAGDIDRARRALAAAEAAFAHNYLWRQAQALVLAADDRVDEARAMLDEDTLKFAALAFPSTFGVAEFYAMTGDADGAIQWLERAVRNGDARTAYFRRSRRLARVRTDPRFLRIVESVESGAAQRRR